MKKRGLRIKREKKMKKIEGVKKGEKKYGKLKKKIHCCEIPA